MSLFCNTMLFKSINSSLRQVKSKDQEALLLSCRDNPLSVQEIRECIKVEMSLEGVSHNDILGEYIDICFR